VEVAQDASHNNYLKVSIQVFKKIISIILVSFIITAF